MIEPCKQGKCISYPVCLGKKQIERCDIFMQYITDYVAENLMKFGEANAKKLNQMQLKLLWTHVDTILPNLTSLSYRINPVHVMKPPLTKHSWSIKSNSDQYQSGSFLKYE